MTSQRRTIGQLAKQVGIGVETIRFYERRGILQQPRRPDSGGYRHYDDDALRLLRYIRIARALSFTLKDIERLATRVADGQPSFCASVRDTAEAKLADVRSELKVLAKLEADIEGFLTSCRLRPTDQPCPILSGLHQPI
jgi:MerR family mercuric resistance operon transcriptional regulator